MANVNAGAPDETLRQLGKVFASVLGARLQGLIVYGSAAGGDWRPGRSDINVLAVVDRVDPGDAAFEDRAFREWLAAHRVSMLTMTPAEIVGSQDVFPMEFLDMQRRRKVLAGKDFLQGLVIEPSNLRHQIEYELRHRLLRLRGALSEGAGGGALDRVLARTAVSALALLRGFLRLEQQVVPDSDDGVLRAACARLQLGSRPVEAALALRLRSRSEPREARSAALGLHEWIEDFAERIDAYEAGMKAG